MDHYSLFKIIGVHGKKWNIERKLVALFFDVFVFRVYALDKMKIDDDLHISVFQIDMQTTLNIRVEID